MKISGGALIVVLLAAIAGAIVYNTFGDKIANALGTGKAEAVLRSY